MSSLQFVTGHDGFTTICGTAGWTITIGTWLVPVEYVCVDCIWPRGFGLRWLYGFWDWVRPGVLDGYCEPVGLYCWYGE